MNRQISILNEQYEEMIKELMVFEDKLSKHLSIDIYNLEMECAEHSSHYHKIAVMTSETGSLQHRAELLVKSLKAEIATNVRNNPEEFGIAKVTEGQILEAVDKSEDAQSARIVRMNCTEMNNRANALLQAFEHRRSMLNNEVQLYLSKLSEPRAEGQVRTMSKALEKKEPRKLVRKVNVES